MVRTVFAALIPLALLLGAAPTPAHSRPADPHATADAAAKPGKPRAELKMKAVSASYVDGQLSVTFTLTNRGAKKAGATQTWIRYFKSPTKIGPQDVGMVATPPVRKGGSKTVTATFPGTSVPSGDVSILACADYGRTVKQRKLENDCKYAAGIVVPADVFVTYSASQTAAGTVSGSSSRGRCNDPGPYVATGTCSVRPGGTITLTASPAPGYSFAGWSAVSGKTCEGLPAGTQLTFDSPTAAQECVANFQQGP